MGKSILVMDTPESCQKCRFLTSRLTGAGVCAFMLSKSALYPITVPWTGIAEYCPFKNLPEKADHPDYCDNGRYDKGWNDCLDQILNGGRHGG